MDIVTLKQKSKISDVMLENVYQELWERTIYGHKSRNSKCQLLIGYHGLYNSYKAKEIAKEHDMIRINLSSILDVHPYYRVLMAMYPNLYVDVLWEDTQKLLEALIKDLIAEGYDFVLEDDLSRPDITLEHLKMLSENGYDVSCRIDRKKILRRQLELLYSWAINLFTKSDESRPESIQVPASFYINKFSQYLSSSFVIMDHFLVLCAKSSVSGKDWQYAVQYSEDGFYAELCKLTDFIKGHAAFYTKEEYQALTGRLEIIENTYYSGLDLDLLVEQNKR